MRAPLSFSPLVRKRSLGKLKDVQSPLLIDNPTPLVCLAVILVPLLGGGAHSTIMDEGRVASNYLCVCANFIEWQGNYIF